MVLFRYILPEVIQDIIKGEFPLVDYSKFKYGEKSSTVKLADELQTILIKNISGFHGDIYLTSTLLKFMPSASHWLSKTLVKSINNYLMSINRPSVRYIEFCEKVTTPTIYNDYASLNKEERVSSLERTISPLLTPKLNINDLLFVVNDAYISGTQHLYYDKFLREHCNNCSIIYLYLCKVDFSKSINSNYPIEKALNDYYFDTNQLFVNFLGENSSSLYPTKRLLLRILSMNENSIIKCAKIIHRELKSELLIYGIYENLHLNTTLSAKFKLFKES